MLLRSDEAALKLCQKQAMINNNNTPRITPQICFSTFLYYSPCGCLIFTSPANLKELISQTITSWAQETHIQDPELVRVMFSLLRRQYDGIGELLRAMKKSYTISAASVQDAINLLASLGQIRSLLSVRMGKEEEKLMIDGLG